MRLAWIKGTDIHTAFIVPLPDFDKNLLVRRRGFLDRQPCGGACRNSRSGGVLLNRLNDARKPTVSCSLSESSQQGNSGIIPLCLQLCSVWCFWRLRP